SGMASGLAGVMSVRRDLDPVPEIDHGNCGREGARLGFTEVLAQAHPCRAIVAFGIEVCQQFGPCERGTLLLREIGYVLPDDKPIQPLVRFSVRTRLPCMHLHAVGTAVELGSPQVHEVVDHAVQSVVVYGGVDVLERSEYARNRGEMVESCIAHVV